MNLTEIKEKFDEIIGLESVVEHKKDGFEEAKLVYSTDTTVIVTIKLFKDDDDNWMFGGYQEGFQSLWPSFCAVTREIGI